MAPRRAQYLSEALKKALPKNLRCTHLGCQYVGLFSRRYELERHRKSRHRCTPEVGNRHFYRCDQEACADKKAWARVDHFRNHVKTHHPHANVEEKVRSCAILEAETRSMPSSEDMSCQAPPVTYEPEPLSVENFPILLVPEDSHRPKLAARQTSTIGTCKEQPFLISTIKRSDIPYLGENESSRRLNVDPTDSAVSLNSMRAEPHLPAHKSCPQDVAQCFTAETCPVFQQHLAGHRSYDSDSSGNQLRSISRKHDVSLLGKYSPPAELRDGRLTSQPSEHGVCTPYALDNSTHTSPAQFAPVQESDCTPHGQSSHVSGVTGSQQGTYHASGDDFVASNGGSSGFGRSGSYQPPSNSGKHVGPGTNSDTVSSNPTPASNAVSSGEYRCVFHRHGILPDLTPKCRNGKKFVSLLTVHHQHSSHPFFYCYDCLTKFSKDGLAAHKSKNKKRKLDCFFRCVTEWCPNYGVAKTENYREDCEHGSSRTIDNEQLFIWNYLYRLAHNLDLVRPPAPSRARAVETSASLPVESRLVNPLGSFDTLPTAEHLEGLNSRLEHLAAMMWVDLESTPPSFREVTRQFYDSQQPGLGMPLPNILHLENNRMQSLFRRRGELTVLVRQYALLLLSDTSALGEADWFNTMLLTNTVMPALGSPELTRLLSRGGATTQDVDLTGARTSSQHATHLTNPSARRLFSSNRTLTGLVAESSSSPHQHPPAAGFPWPEDVANSTPFGNEMHAAPLYSNYPAWLDLGSLLPNSELPDGNLLRGSENPIDNSLATAGPFNTEQITRFAESQLITPPQQIRYSQFLDPRLMETFDPDFTPDLQQAWPSGDSGYSGFTGQGKGKAPMCD